jgi:MFS family permease
MPSDLRHRGQPPDGAVTQGIDWHWIFWVNVPIGLAATTVSRIRPDESRGAAARLDLPAVGLVSGGAVGIVWALVRASRDNGTGWRLVAGGRETMKSRATKRPRWRREETD